MFIEFFCGLPSVVFAYKEKLLYPDMIKIIFIYINLSPKIYQLNFTGIFYRYIAVTVLSMRYQCIHIGVSDDIYKTFLALRRIFYTLTHPFEEDGVGYSLINAVDSKIRTFTYRIFLLFKDTTQHKSDRAGISTLCVCVWCGV